MAFLGTYPYAIDQKRRVPIPPLYRDAFVRTLEDEKEEKLPAILTTGLEPCVIVYTEAGFEEASQRIESIPEETEEGRDARRDFFANAQPIIPDGQYRLTLQEKWAQHAGLINKEVVVIGAGKWMEIWDKAAWESRDTSRASARRRETQAMARKPAATEAGS